MTRLLLLLPALLAPLPAAAQMPAARPCNEAMAVMPWRPAADGRQGWLLSVNPDSLPHNPQTGRWAFILAMDPLPGFTADRFVMANSGQAFATRTRGTGDYAIPFGAGNVSAEALRGAMRLTCRPVPTGG